MTKKIFSIGFQIPGFDEPEQHFSDQSLLDADVIVFEPEHLWSSEEYHGKPCYDENKSFELVESTNHWLTEISIALASGKTVFVFFARYEEIYVTLGRREESKYDNYRFIPVKLPPIIPKGGTQIRFNNDPIFAVFWREFRRYLVYESYMDGKIGNPVFTTVTASKPLGGVFTVGTGHLVLLPPLRYSEEKFTKRKGDEEFWTGEACEFGEKLRSVLLDIDVALRGTEEDTPPPNWVAKAKYMSESEKRTKTEIAKICQKMDKLLGEKNQLVCTLAQENSLKQLLYAKGKGLEGAIIQALEILGYKAENYDDGLLELDQVITAPEGDRFIGEAEGKDNSPINIDKFRQLATNIQEDVQREQINAPAPGILFANGYRLTEPGKRSEQFTKKCMTTNKTFKHILIRTADLFQVVKYTTDSGDKAYAKKCRTAIRNGQGTIVTFPEVPPKGNKQTKKV